MNRLRPLLLLVLISVMAVATWRVFGAKGPVTDRLEVIGSWEDSFRAMSLRDDGLYWIAALSTSSSSIAECGRWRLIEDSFQMRVKGSRGTATMGNPVLLSKPWLRAGSVDGVVSTSMFLTLVPAIRGAREERWSLHRSHGPLAYVPTDEEKRWLERTCDLR